MQQSRRGLLGLVPLFLAGCGGFEPRDFGASVPPRGVAGLAGFSYDAGTAEAGHGSSQPPRRSPTGDWGPAEAVAGDGGAPSDPSGEGPAPAGDGSAGVGGSDATEGEGGAAGRGGSDVTGGRGGSDAAGRSGQSETGSSGAAGRPAAGAGGAGGHGGVTARGGTSGGAGAAGRAGGSGEGGEGTSARSLLFSEYVEGTGSDKALELRAVAPSGLDGCSVVIYSNGKTDGSRRSLAGKLAEGETYVLCSSKLADELGAVCDRTLSITFTGNDAITLECDGAVVDSVGQIGVDPDSAWSGEGISTANQTLRRLCAVTEGDRLATDAYDPSVEWRAHPTDDVSGLGSADCD